MRIKTLPARATEFYPNAKAQTAGINP